MNQGQCWVGIMCLLVKASHQPWEGGRMEPHSTDEETKAQRDSGLLPVHKPRRGRVRIGILDCQMLPGFMTAHSLPSCWHIVDAQKTQLVFPPVTRPWYNRDVLMAESQPGKWKERQLCG